ncbi:2-methoxy-6-polyprenyl-1,4-benzoquinol methylase, mitochondrial [Hippocampus zosterae]|uniref:2-methoxy-6-polyprenyl-1,4-benzoquinol methylase, mitochondrial n=1 Tax=Hippocampus zosterae TaxID=109293 RepID=UPI00223E834E|nr:2-methoxy-6-polyprenyl-1,4-benzoquinol methylase, mitochondrial [Hippocampus zosterae]
MAASVRPLLERMIFRPSAGAVSVSVADGWRPSPRCYATASCRSFSGGAAEKSTHFGFETVPESEKAKKVYTVFENVAHKYDVMNDAMSLGIHRLWKDALLRAAHPQPGARLLDVAGGTGDIAFRFLEYVGSQKGRWAGRSSWWQDICQKDPGNREEGEEGPTRDSRVVVCDINKEMLKVGRRKARRTGLADGVLWVAGDAEELPFDDAQFDIYTIAFGLRNVTHVELALREALRVLKPGGRFMCLEFSRVTDPVLARLYDAYSFQVIPLLGEVIAGDWKSYRYLVESIRRFPAQEALKELLEDAGFCRVGYRNMSGGVVSLHSGFKL